MVSFVQFAQNCNMPQILILNDDMSNQTTLLQSSKIQFSCTQVTTNLFSLCFSLMYGFLGCNEIVKA
jgi:hypothetical protein